jgi:hypothetical protein
VTAGDVAALILSVAALMLAIVLLLTLRILLVTTAALRETTEELRRTALPMVSDVRDTVNHTNAELERVGSLIGTAQSISTTVDRASRLAYLAVSNPVVKVAAVSSGTARAARSLRRRPKG